MVRKLEVRCVLVHARACKWLLHPFLLLFPACKSACLTAAILMLCGAQKGEANLKWSRGRDCAENRGGDEGQLCTVEQRGLGQSPHLEANGKIVVFASREV
jgi:hypothetical protein